MGRKTILIDDLDGSELTDESGEEVFITYKGTSFRIDLSTKNVEKLDKVLQPYLNAAEKIGSQRGRPRGSSSTRAPSGSGRSKEELANIREWLKKNGHEVNERGRIKAELLQAFDEAHAPAS